jgi:hypothetical protein
LPPCFCFFATLAEGVFATLAEGGKKPSAIKQARQACKKRSKKAWHI